MDANSTATRKVAISNHPPSMNDSVVTSGAQCLRDGRYHAAGNRAGGLKLNRRNRACYKWQYGQAAAEHRSHQGAGRHDPQPMDRRRVEFRKLLESLAHFRFLMNLATRSHRLSV